MERPSTSTSRGHPDSMTFIACVLALATSNSSGCQKRSSCNIPGCCLQKVRFDQLSPSLCAPDYLKHRAHLAIRHTGTALPAAPWPGWLAWPGAQASAYLWWLPKLEGSCAAQQARAAACSLFVGGEPPPVPETLVVAGHMHRRALPLLHAERSSAECAYLFALAGG